MRGKIGAYIAALLLSVANFVAPVMAALPDGFIDDNHQSTSSIVSYTQSSDFTVTIPAEINFTALGQTVSSEVTATNLSVAEDEYIYVDFVSTNVGMKHGDERVMYSFETSRDIPTVIDNKHHKVLSVVDDSDAISPTSMSSIFNLTSEEEPEITSAGQYSDTLTFTMSILPKIENIEKSVWQFDGKIDPTTLATRIENDDWIDLSAYFNYGAEHPHPISAIKYDLDTYGDNIDFDGGGSFNMTTEGPHSTELPDDQICFTYGHDIHAFGIDFEGWTYIKCSGQVRFWYGEMNYDEYIANAIENWNKKVPTFAVYSINTERNNESGFIDWLYENATFLHYDEEMVTAIYRD